MEFCLRIVLLLSAVAITAVVGNGRGAPPAACDSITPEGHGTSTTADPVPYNVNISSLDNGYIAGETYTIVLSGTSQNADFAGFLIQGRMVADNTTRVGTFIANGGDQQTACSSSSATHTSSDQKTAVQLMWIAPPIGTGAILFRYAFVESFSVFWPNQVTGEVTEAAATTTTTDAATATTTASSVTTTASVATASTSSVASSPSPTTDITAAPSSTADVYIITAAPSSTTDVTAAPTTTTDAPATASAADDIVTSSVVMPSAVPTGVMTTSSTTPTVEATPAGGATGVMGTSSLLILLLASVIILIM